MLLVQVKACRTYQNMFLEAIILSRCNGLPNQSKILLWLLGWYTDNRGNKPGNFSHLGKQIRRVSLVHEEEYWADNGWNPLQLQISLTLLHLTYPLFFNLAIPAAWSLADLNSQVIVNNISESNPTLRSVGNQSYLLRFFLVLLINFFTVPSITW